MRQLTEDLKGKSFGKWEVVEFAGYKGKYPHAIWLCKCECGATKEVAAYSLKNGKSKSCGCATVERAKQLNRRHGKSGTPEYRTWKDMRYRCNNPANNSYYKYGARGITVCERWNNSFESFLEDMGPKPSPQHSLDRVDNSKGYEPGNCRWASVKQQNRNTRVNRNITYSGKTKCLIQWAEETGISFKTLQKRLDSGWTIEDALTKPVRKFYGNQHRKG